MNILFFLTPKSEVIYVNEEDTVGQAMDTMEKYKYSAVPIITKAGRYAGTLTEGDLLWGLKNKTDLVQKGLKKCGSLRFHAVPIISRYLSMRIWKIFWERS